MFQKGGKGKEEGESEGRVNCDSPMKVEWEVGIVDEDDWRLGP